MLLILLLFFFILTGRAVFCYSQWKLTKIYLLQSIASLHNIIEVEEALERRGRDWGLSEEEIQGYKKQIEQDRVELNEISSKHGRVVKASFFF